MLRSYKIQELKLSVIQENKLIFQQQIIQILNILDHLFDYVLVRTHKITIKINQKLRKQIKTNLGLNDIRNRYLKILFQIYFLQKFVKNLKLNTIKIETKNNVKYL
jgi:hypothetical protein